MLGRITKGGYLVIRIVTGVLAVIFLTYSLLTLWDMYRTEIKAFASYDLLKYRPDIEHDEPPYLDDLLKINPDTAAWLTIYGTNIDYPVMQGENDNVYLNKSATGEYTITGSIFMSSRNSKDFSDPYTLIYGHHVVNGSMFGDIEKFQDKDFFYNTKSKRFKTDEGVLIMENVVYNLQVFAFLDTHAYNDMVYASQKSDTEFNEFLEYAKNNNKFYKNLGTDIDKVIALSTCYDATTDGRMVLLCSAKLRTDPLPTREEEPLTPHRKAVGHPMAGAYWSLLNLIIMLMTVYTALPLHLYKSLITEFKTDKKRFFIYTGLGAISLALFIITEDLHKPIQVVDVWTPVMIFTLIILFLLRKWSFKDEENNSEFIDFLNGTFTNISIRRKRSK